MIKVIQFLFHIKSVIKFYQLPKQKRRLVFYSEGKNYWVHLEGLVKEVLSASDISICYISSGEDDPGLSLEHPNYQTFKIDEGFVRNWLFENLETDVIVMTMPDLHQYQVKRSKHKVHYVYTQHSLVSFHMVYREFAFDCYDTIFCAGPHHIDEMRAIEIQYNLPKKNLVEHGYGRLDSIIEEAQKRATVEKIPSTPIHVLIAPSWGPKGTIESGLGEEIVDLLVSEGYKVTLRPHPQTIKFTSEKIDNILSKHKNNPFFIYENNVATQESLHDSDIMISDWSGAALDYAFGLDKPVIFIDVPRKINNKNYLDIELEPFEVSIRSEIGSIIAPECMSDLPMLIKKHHKKQNKHKDVSTIFNISNSSSIGGRKLITLLTD